MVEAKVIMSPFDPLDFLRCELRKPILEKSLFQKPNPGFLHKR